MAQAWSLAHCAATIALTGKNLTATKNTASTEVSVYAVQGVIGGKWYWEVTMTSANQNATAPGIGNTGSTTANFVGATTDTMGWYQSGGFFSNNASIATWATWGTSGVLLCFALDLVNNKIWGRVGAAGNWNNAAIGSQNPANNTGGVAVPSAVFASPVVPGLTLFNQTTPDKGIAAFDSGSWAGVPPGGFSDLNIPFLNYPLQIWDH